MNWNDGFDSDYINISESINNDLVFGLNEGYLKDFKYTSGNNYEGIQTEFIINEKEIKKIYFFPNRCFYQNYEIFDSHEKYKEILSKNKNQFWSIILHTLKSVKIEEEKIRNLKPANYDSLQGWINDLANLVTEENKNVKLHIFLQYQNKLSNNSNRTYLELPNNMYNGSFLTPDIWNADINNWKIKNTIINKKGQEKKGLFYILKEGDKNSIMHPFNRDTYFMESNLANQIRLTKPVNNQIQNNSNTNNSWEDIDDDIPF